jgi:UDP-N-acetyl-D-mannosaminuronic acid dehydrogenase
VCLLVRKKKVLVIGLGRIGLPTAFILKKNGFSVCGVDTNEKVLDQIKSKTFMLDEPGLEALYEQFPFPFSNKPLAADIYIIAVPTPLSEDKTADLSFVEQAVSSIRPLLKQEDLVIIESTCPIGTTEKIGIGLPGINLAYCPERVLPGNLLFELVQNDRVVGGIDKKSTDLAEAFYSNFIEGKIHKTNASTAEAIKLAQNAYRDVNIAFANELSMIFEKHKISCLDAIKLANHHPRVNILSPGPGVGGHCLAVDPYFLLESGTLSTSVISSARKINQSKVKWTLAQIEAAITRFKPKKIACLGLTYKPDVNDFRESPALAISTELANRHQAILLDPFLQSSTPLDESLGGSDMVVKLVGHTCYSSISSETLSDKLFLDFSTV